MKTYIVFQFTPALRRATAAIIRPRAPPRVSIHARLATGDNKPCRLNYRTKVSIHARLATGDKNSKKD